MTSLELQRIKYIKLRQFSRNKVAELQQVRKTGQRDAEPSGRARRDMLEQLCKSKKPFKVKGLVVVYMEKVTHTGYKSINNIHI